MPTTLLRGLFGSAEPGAANSGSSKSLFVPIPFGDGQGPRLYRTGDIVKYLPGGNIDDWKPAPSHSSLHLVFSSSSPNPSGNAEKPPMFISSPSLR
jgi:hypothetical protein